MGQGLAILAWVAFAVSFFLPVHMVIAQPMMYGWDFHLTFLFYLLLLPFSLIISGFDIDILAGLFFAIIYTIGNLLLFIAPLVPYKLNHPVWQRIHLGVVLVCTLAAIAYRYLENIQLGYMHYRGYDFWVLAYVLLSAGSILMMVKQPKTR